MTEDGKVFVPADETALALRLSLDSDVWPGAPRPSTAGYDQLWKPRYIRFVHHLLTRTVLLIEVPGIGQGVAGETFG